MKRYFFSFFFFSFILCHLAVNGSERGWDIFQDEAIENHSFSSTEGLLSSIIANHVSAISGEFVDQATDCVLVGPEPLTLQRSYTPQASIGMFGFEALPLYPRAAQFGTQFCGWQFNHFTTLHFQADSTKHARHAEASAFVPHVFFSQMLHRQRVKITAGKHDKGNCSLPLLHQKGITNCSSGAISGRTNPKNVVAHFKDECRSCDVAFGSGNTRHYEGKLKEMNDDGQIGIWKFFPRYEKKANGNQIIYGDEQAYAYNASETVLYSWFKFLWVSKKELKVETSHFKDPIIYQYEPFKTKQAQPNDRKERYYLTSLQRPDQPHEFYEYIPDIKKEAWLLHRKILPDQRVLEIDYYQMRDQPGESHKILIDDYLDPRLNRVKCLKAPVGADATPLITHQFFYDMSFKIDHKKNRVKTYEGCTTVYDAYDRKSSYFYNPYHRLERFIQYADGKPYVQTKYLWEDIEKEIKDPYLNIVFTFSSADQGNLLGKVMLDGKGNPLWGRFFYYDERGNIETEKFVGNLTGKNVTPLLLDKHRPVDNGAESYQRYFIYSNDEYNLLLEESEPTGRKMRYAYQPHSDLICAKFLLDHEHICIREFYEYDENNALMTYICDNGTQEQHEDLSNVTERHITRYSPRQEIPVGLPEIIDELVFDFEKEEEKLIKRTKRKYSLQGKVLKQHVYHADDVYCYTLEWEYDDHGNVIKEVNALGHTIYREYDNNDNLTKEKGPDPEFEAIHEYDFSNRRISTEIHTNEDQFITKTLYDLVGNRIAHIDRYGNRTSYKYDDLNRLICTTYPLTAGESEPNTTKLEYDCLGNVIKEINALDFVTKKTYNARGKVTSILHPDGQLEKFEYGYDGALAKKITSNGTETWFEVDCFGRILSETLYSANGKRVQKISQTFDSLHKTSSTDATGLVTYFTYDKAGKLIKTVCQDKIEIYEYDLQGRLAKKKEPLEENKIKVTCTEYDFLDRVIEERIEDEQGQLFKKVAYQYDFFGNRTHVIEETQAGRSQHVTLYNSDKKPIKIIDPKNNETHFSYTYTFLNEWDQFVLQMTMTDPLGRQVITTYDARERPVTIKKVDSFGLLLAQQEIAYDGNGQILSMIDHVIVQGEDTRCIETSFAYQKMGQLTCLTLAKDLPEQQITRFKYNAYGEKKTVVKGDGTLLNYTYDALGRVSTYFSSENSLSYQYTYNSRNQPLEVKDVIQKTSSLFNYDERGHLETETLSTGVALSYEYDLLDRVIALILPDTSRVNYEYDVANLKCVARVKNQQLIYAHQYDAFDLTGLNLKATAINHQESAYTYDLLRRPLAIENHTYQQQHSQYDTGNRLVQYTVKDPVGSLQIHYTYDDNDHLVSEQGHMNHLYACDSLHNRLSKNQQVSTSNALHQLVDNGESTFSYDDAGNLHSKQTAEAITTYRYDAADRLIAIQSDKETRYLYDAFHRRVAKIEGDKTTHYLYVGQDEIGSLDEEGQIQELRILGQGVGAEIGATIAIELQDQVFAPSHDLRGNIVCLTDLKGNPVETYRYTAFGETTIYNAKGEKITTSLVKNPWRFSSKRVDEESGFVFFGRRYYDAENGRWITADPAGLTDGPNLYAYLHHHPTHGFDLYGLQEETNQAQEPYYPLQNVDYHENENEKSQEDAMPNEAPLGFIEKRSGKKQQLFFCGLSQIAELGVGFMHGIMNTLQDACGAAKALSKMIGDHYVTFSYNKSHGFLLDVIRCFCELYLYMKTPAVRNLQIKWDAYFAHTSPTAMYYHECHSEGAIITRNALMSYPEGYRKRIIIAAFAPGAYIDKKYAYQVTHYRSTRDIVPFFDFIGAFRCRETTVVLKPHRDAPWFDHSIDSSTYQPYRYEQITSYHKKYGGSACAQSNL